MNTSHTQARPQWRGENWKRPFFTIWGGQALSLLGSSIAMFALIWWITDETGSATVLAIASLFSMLPGVILGPFAGVLVDRWNRRVIMIAADSVIALASLLLAYLFWVGDVQVWHIYTVMFIRALGSMFHTPAMFSSTALMVPEEHLARVSGLNQAIQGGLSIVGPALGALLLTVLNIYAILLLDVVTAAFAVGPLLFIAIPQPEASAAPNGAGKASVWGDFRAALAYLRRWRGLMLLTGVGLVAKLALTPAASLIPILVTQHFNGGAGAMATGEALLGIGVISGGLLLGVWGGFERSAYTIISGIMLMALSMLALGVLPAQAFSVAAGMLFVTGAAVALIDGPFMAVMQKAIAPEMHGRVFMLFNSLISLSSPVGLAIAGPFTDFAGIQTLYLIAGLLMGGMGLAIRFTPAIMHLEDHTQANDSAPEGVQATLPESDTALPAPVQSR